MDFKSQKSISGLQAVFSKAWVLCSSHQNKVVCSVGIFQELEQREGGVITNVNQRGCRPREAPVTGKQCLTNVIVWRPLQRQNSFHRRSLGEERCGAITPWQPSARLEDYMRTIAANATASAALMTTAQVLWFLLLSLLLTEEKRRLCIRPRILYFKGQNFSSLQLHAMHFTPSGGWGGGYSALVECLRVD